jgi:predicted RNA-binding protein
MQKGDRQDAVMQDVAWISAEGDGLRVTSLLGDSILLQAQITSVDLMKSRVVLEETTGSAAKMVSERGAKTA